VGVEFRFGYDAGSPGSPGSLGEVEDFEGSWHCGDCGR
jgi:hypothetical protein